MQNIENFSSYFDRSKFVILTIRLVENYCFVLVGNVAQVINVKFGVNKRIFFNGKE